MTNFIWLLIFVFGVVSGAAALFRELLIVHVHPYMSIFLRVAFANILFFIFFVIRYKGVYLNNKIFGLTKNNFITLMFVGVFSGFIPFLSVTTAQLTITGGLATIIVSATAFNTIVLSAIFIPMEKLKLHRLTGVILGTIGVAVAIGIGGQSGNIESGLLAFLGSISYAIGAVIARIYLQDSPKLTSVLITHFSILICISPLLFITKFDQFALLTPTLLIYGFLLALLPSVIGGITYFYILENSGAGNALVGTIFSAPCAMILEAIFLDEITTANQLWGFFIIVVGMLILDGRIFKVFKSY